MYNQIEAFLNTLPKSQNLTPTQRKFVKLVLSQSQLRPTSFYANRLGLKSRNSIQQYKLAIRQKLGVSLKRLHSQYRIFIDPKPVRTVVKSRSIGQNIGFCQILRKLNTD